MIKKIIFFLFLSSLIFNRQAKAQTNSQVFNLRVLFVTSNPVENGTNLIQDSYPRILNGMTVSQFEDYWANRLINSFKALSGNTINYSVVKKINLTSFPRFTNGYVYNLERYRTLCAAGRPECENQKWLFDNVAWATDNRICEIAWENNVDEIWWLTVHGLGIWENLMLGPDSGYWVNGDWYVIPACRKHYLITVGNYTAMGNMFESYAHRVEANLSFLTNNWSQAEKDQSLNNFIVFNRYGHDNPYDRPSCGNAHFPHNAAFGYNDDNQTYGLSTCIDWQNFPNFTGATQNINCSAWGCTNWGWQMFWLGSLPRSDGEAVIKDYNNTDIVIKKNWWYYLLYPENTLNARYNPARPTSTPTPTHAVCPRAAQGNLSCDNTGIIDTRDLEIFTDSWQATGPAPTPYPNNASADLKRDNKVDETDLTILLANWGLPLVLPTNTPVPTATNIPTSIPPIASPTPTSYPNLTRCPQSLPVEDSFIDQYNPTRNYDNPEHSNNQIRLFKGNVATPQRGLIKFDLTTLTTPINKAYLRLYVAGWDGANGGINVYQIKQPWKETEVTWNKADNITPWQKPGADGTNDRIMTPAASMMTSGILRYLNIDITNLVKNWLAQPQINQGVMLVVGTPEVPDKSSNESFVILSSEFPYKDGGPCLIAE